MPYGAEVLGVEVFRIGQEALVGAKVLVVGATGVEVGHIGQEALSIAPKHVLFSAVSKTHE